MDLLRKVDNVCSIKGVAFLTAITIISETNGFELIENKAQLVSYAGFDVVERQSGSSVRGKTRISKKGNSHIRRALHYPALSAVRYEGQLRELYKRVTERNPKVKMIGLVAVQRKLLVLIYTLWLFSKASDKPPPVNFEHSQIFPPYCFTFVMTGAYARPTVSFQTKRCTTCIH